MLKNLIIFKLDTKWTLTPGDLEELLSKHPLVQPTALMMASRGWVPVGAEKKQLVYSSENRLMICIGTESKVIPASTLRRKIVEKAEDLERQQGFKPGRKQLRDIKDAVQVELMARAMTKLAETLIWIDTMNGYICVDTGSNKRAEEAISTLRDCLGGTLAVNFLEPATSPSVLMGAWLAKGEASNALEIGEAVELVSSDGKKATARFSRHMLVDAQEVTTHIEQGKTVSKLALRWNDSAEFTLTDALAVKSIKYMAPPSESEPNEDPAAEFDADFELKSYAIQGVIGSLAGAFEIPA